MEKKKKIILLASIAGSVVLIGIVIALLLTPITTFLHGGTGKDFQNVQSCGGKSASEPSATSDVFVTPETTPAQPEQTPAATQEAETPTPTPSPTVDPYEQLYSKADTSMMKDIVNILLVGVDYSTERDTWSGKKEWHSDVMIVLAVNFEENRADLISLPRDTYAKIPDVKGIYKLNASINCGGGLYRDDGTFNPKSLEKVCESAEWMLGGIPVDYYYAVTMTSLKDLVDLCGGVDYDMDIDFHIQGRSYQKGMQHLNGQGFLDYCRVRKGENGLKAGEIGDDKRVQRQKKILVALFRQMQADKLITQIPDIIDTFSGDLFTNCSYGQTAALAAFAYNLNAENIGMYSMGGSTTSLFQWHFCFTDQNNRVKIINTVYNVEASRHREYTLSYGRYRWCSMLYDQYKPLLDPLTKYVQNLIDEDDKLPEFTSSPTPSETPTEVPDTPSPTAEPTKEPTKAPTKEPTKAPTAAPTAAPTEEPTKAPTKEPTAAPTEPPTQAPTEAPTDAPTEAPTEAPTQAPTEAPTDAHTEAPTDSPDAQGKSGTAAKRAISVHRDNPTPELTRQIPKEQRDLFDQYLKCIDELEEIREEADKQAKKAKKGKSNTLDSVGQNYLKKLAEVQELAIKVATAFSYNKVKNFTVPYAPTATYWNTNSPWAVNYGKDRKFNEVIVDFN